jgi:hypothetical protein
MDMFVSAGSSLPAMAQETEGSQPESNGVAWLRVAKLAPGKEMCS